MSLKTPVEIRKGRSGERIFAVALFLTLIVAAAVAWFVVAQQNAENADKAFQSAHERFVGAADDAVTRLSIDFEYLSAQYAASMRAEPSNAGTIRSVARNLAVFDSDGKAALSGIDVFAPQNPALRSAKNSPYPHDILFARSPFTGERAVLFTAAFEDVSGETFVLVMEAAETPLANSLLLKDPERKDVLLLVAQDGSVIVANQERPAISNLVQWAEKAAAKGEEPRPLYVLIRDRIAGFSTYESDDGAFRMAFSPVSGTDWMLCQIEFVE